MTIFEEINQLAGREIEFMETTFENQKGYLPIYINYNMKPSEVFDTDQEESAKKFLTYLKNNQGDTNDSKPGSEQPSSSQD